jgi:hypothetical protein
VSIFEAKDVDAVIGFIDLVEALGQSFGANAAMPRRVGF